MGKALIAAVFLIPAMVIAIGVGAAIDAAASECDTGSFTWAGGHEGEPLVTVSGGFEGSFAGVFLTGEQTGNAVKIIEQGKRMDLPDRAIIIALMTAIQESSLRALNYGDAAGPDSRGLFQQRSPWGTLEQRMDPHQSSELFYNVLVKPLVPVPIHNLHHLEVGRAYSYTEISLSDAAQLVQVSALPGLYARHEPVARALFSTILERDPDIGAVEGCDSNITIENAGESLVFVSHHLEGYPRIQVHESIGPQLAQLIQAAARDKIILAGQYGSEENQTTGGYRSNEQQKRLRVDNCPSIRSMDSPNMQTAPSTSCNPPTAVPGTSEHERGLAIDFTCSGSGFKASDSRPGLMLKNDGELENDDKLGRNNICFVWLKNNAHKYGLINYSDEPWHWSTTGR